MTEIFDSPTGWVAKHIQSYVDSGGAQGGRYYGYEALLLTTRGRRSGKLRRTALYYGKDGDRVILVASNGGSETHPNWYRNLAEDPAVTIQIGPEVYAATARVASAQERPGLWDLMTSVFPRYADYQQKAAREIPIIVIERNPA